MVNTIRQKELQQGFLDLKKELLEFINQNKIKLSQQDFKSHYYILKILDDLIVILAQDEIPNQNKRHAVLSSLVVELPKYVLDPKLGGKMIDLEKRYLEL